MTIPAIASYLVIRELTPRIDEMLRYCIAMVLEHGESNSMGYDSSSDRVTYHMKVNDADRALFEHLVTADEVWVITKARRES